VGGQPAGDELPRTAKAEEERAMFQALVLSKKDDAVTAAVEDVDDARLPEGDVTVAVEHSTLNYKDGLIISNKAPLVRTYPHVPGIDFAGRVVESAHPDWRPGDAVVLTGWGVGERHWGGYAQRARVKGDWLVPLPAGWRTEHAMAVGTAGFTAMLAVRALEDHGLRPGDGEVLVTGAAGGVGSVAVALLARLGHQVTASTGRAASHDYLRGLGASACIDRAELAAPSSRPLESERFAGCIDAVGGTTLARVLTQMKYRCSVAAVGLAGGSELHTTVIPFLLRGVNLLGIDSVYQPAVPRRAAWQRLARDLDLAKLAAMTVKVRLQDLPRLADEILQGRVQGRVIVDPNR
jgi:acrylyl-CoA reductase (NADPH)